MRRLTLAALSAALVLTACSDRESPTEPSVPAPQETFSSTCTVVPFPLQAISSQIVEVFPQGRLRFEALARAAAIKLFWDTCHPDAARRIAVSFIQWMNENFDRKKLRGATEQEVQDLTIAILAGVGVPVDAPTSEGDVGVGIYDGEKTIIKTASEVALTEIEADAFADGEPRLIVVRRLADNFRLSNFGGNQFEPFFDYDATKLEGTTTNADKILAPGKFAIIAFCLFPPPFVYPDFVGIGHNPVEGAPGFPFEILPPVDLPAERPDLVQELSCGNLQENPGPIDLGGGLSGLLNGARQAAGRFLVPLVNSVLLPEPLWAAASVGTLGPIGGKTTSISPFGTVEVGATDVDEFGIGVGSEGAGPYSVGQPLDTCGDGCYPRFRILDGETVVQTPTAITVSLIPGEGSTGTLDGTKTRTTSGAPDYIATFDDLTISAPGSYQLLVTAPGANSYTTGSFTVNAAPGALTLYGVNSGDDGLSTIDTTTGVSSLIGRLGGANLNLYATPVAMGVRPSDGTLYAWNNSGDGNTEGAATGVLLTVDPITGQATPVNSGTAPQGGLGALAFTPGGEFGQADTLYGVSSELVQIDLATGAIDATIGSIGLNIGGADIDCSGTLYGVELTGATTQKLVTINRGTGAVMTQTSLSQNIGAIGSIVFLSSGILIGSSFGGPLGDILFDIDKATGTVSNVRTMTGGTAAQGLGAARTCNIIN